MVKSWKRLSFQYQNNFDWENWKKSNKWISIDLKLHSKRKFYPFIFFELYLNFECNLRSSKDFQDYDHGKLKIKHRLSGIFITLLSRKYYLIYLNFPHYTKDFTIFRDRFERYPEHWIPIISKIKSFYYGQKLKKIYKQVTIDPSWEISDDRKSVTFKIPVGNISRSKAISVISKTKDEFNKKFKFNENGEININQ